jgi:hypothetical protein
VAQVINHSGYTSGGKKPCAKIRMVYADCYFMNLTKAARKILAFTNSEFFDIPYELKEKAQRVTSMASKEMTK